MLISLHIQRCGLLKSSRMTPPSYPMPHISACVNFKKCWIYDGAAKKPIARQLPGPLSRPLHVEPSWVTLPKALKSLAADVNSYFASAVADATRIADKRIFFRGGEI